MTAIPPSHLCNSLDILQCSKIPAVPQTRKVVTLRPIFTCCSHCYCFLLPPIMKFSMSTIATETTFASITESKKTILEYITGRGESYHVQQVDKCCWLA